MNVPATAPDDQSKEPAAAPAPGPNKAELDRVFGTTPTSTRDDIPDPEIQRSADDWFLENRPPHHEG